MIIVNRNDKLIKSAAEEINALQIFKGMKGLRNLYVYGIAQARSVDVMIPQGFPSGNYLHTLFQAQDLRVMRGSLWTMSETYNNKVLGLGHNIRKNNQELCKRIMLIDYLALNSMIAIPEQFAIDSDFQQGE